MSMRIRLARGGTKKRPFYRIVVADTRSPRDGRFIEKIGLYNPMVPKDHPERLRLDFERIKHWLSLGAKPSDRIARFLGHAEILPPPPIPKQTKKNLPHPKTLERRAAAEAKKAAKATPKPEEAVEATTKPEEAVEATTEPEEAAEAAPKPEEVAEAAPKPEEAAEAAPDVAETPAADAAKEPAKD